MIPSLFEGEDVRAEGGHTEALPYTSFPRKRESTTRRRRRRIVHNGGLHRAVGVQADSVTPLSILHTSGHFHPEWRMCRYRLALSGYGLQRGCHSRGGRIFELSPKGVSVKAVVYQEPYKVIDGYTKVLIKPGMAA